MICKYWKLNFQITAAVVTFLSIPSEIFDFIPTCFNTSRKGKKGEKEMFYFRLQSCVHAVLQAIVINL